MSWPLRYGMCLHRVLQCVVLLLVLVSQSWAVDEAILQSLIRFWTLDFPAVPAIEHFPRDYLVLTPENGETTDNSNYRYKLIFATRTPENGIEPWVSDGTPEGTMILKDIIEGARSFLYESAGFTLFRGRAYFTSSDLSGTDGLWSTDGTPNGTNIINSDTNGEHMTVIDDTLYILRRDFDPFGQDNWTMVTVDSNNTVRDIATFPNDFGSLKRQGMVSLAGGERIVMLEENNNTLVTYQRSIGEFHTIFGLNQQGAFWSTRRHNWVVLGDYRIIMAGVESDRGMILGTDGTVNGTSFVTTSLNRAFRMGLRPIKDSSVFMVWEDGGISDDNVTCLGNLYWTDGVSLGLITVMDLEPAHPDEGCPSPHLVVFATGRDQQLLAYPHMEDGLKLWLTDGTAQGTTVLSHLYPGEAVTPRAYQITVEGNIMLIFQRDDLLEIWVIDFTETGKRKVGILPPNITRVVRVSEPLGVGNTFLFGAEIDQAAIELWRLDLPPGPTPSPLTSTSTMPPAAARPPQGPEPPPSPTRGPTPGPTPVPLPVEALGVVSTPATDSSTVPSTYTSSAAAMSYMEEITVLLSLAFWLC